jgi:UDP-3-O-[3-hydroxymyristoyl] N-acetylglucosamine deacetylase
MLLRELLATEDAWELVTFEGQEQAAPISYHRPVAAG